MFGSKAREIEDLQVDLKAMSISKNEWAEYAAAKEVVIAVSKSNHANSDREIKKLRNDIKISEENFKVVKAESERRRKALIEVEKRVVELVNGATEFGHLIVKIVNESI